MDRIERAFLVVAAIGFYVMVGSITWLLVT
jgi:hypothetical protein